MDPLYAQVARGHATRVLLADVAGAARRAMAALLRSLPEVDLLAEAGTPAELRRALLRTPVDVLVVDDRLVNVPELDLRDAGVALIVVGLDDDPSFAQRARGLGALTWIPKECAAELLPDALRPRSSSGSGPPCAEGPRPATEAACTSATRQ